MALTLTVISIMDIRMHTWFSTVFVVVFLTIIGCIIFFLIENYANIGVNRYTYYIIDRAPFRFWTVIFLNIGAVYTVKSFYDTVYH